MVKLTDVPRGRAGPRRGLVGIALGPPRELGTYSEVTPLEPGQIYEWKIAVWPTARVCEAGHRIRIEILSSNFPRYNHNLNAGGELTGTTSTDALQIIHHDAVHPSHVELPIVPMETLQDKVISGPPQSQ